MVSEVLKAIEFSGVEGTKRDEVAIDTIGKSAAHVI
jgi:hypothetical protein